MRFNGIIPFIFMTSIIWQEMFGDSLMLSLYLQPFVQNMIKERDVAQVVEYTSGGRVVAGSSPVIPTTKNGHLSY